MKRISARDMTVDQLIQEFIALAVEQGDALLADDGAAVNRIYWELKAIEKELKSRDGDQRRALIPLYDHPNPQVRVKAAKATLAIAPEAARSVLEQIAEKKNHPQAVEAGMSLWNLDQGVYKPT